MPEKSGLEVIEELRKDLGEELPIVLCSSFDSDEIKNSGDEFIYLTKPIRQKVLFEFLRNIFSEKKQDQVLKPKITNQLKNNYSVLLVEDNIINQKLARKTLKKLGVEPELAVNGEIAIDMTSKKKYDLILMDIHMPVMDGLNATRIIQSREKNPPPIIIMSADIFKNKEYDDITIKDYILKPIKMSDIESMFSKLGFY